MTAVNRPEAETDVLVAARWLNGFNPGAGDRFAADVDAYLRHLLSRPRVCGRVSRPPRGREVRQGLIPGTSFLITYELTPTQLIVWCVGHARQRTQPWRRRLTASPP